MKKNEIIDSINSKLSIIKKARALVIFSIKEVIDGNPGVAIPYDKNYEDDSEPRYAGVNKSGQHCIFNDDMEEISYIEDVSYDELIDILVGIREYFEN